MQLAHPPADRLGATAVLVRALLLATVILSCAAFSHVLADGLLPSTSGLAWLLLGTTLAVRSFLRRPAGRARLLALVVGGQAVLHLFLSAMAGHGVSRTEGAPAPPLPATTGGSLADQYAARQDALAAASGHTSLDPSSLIAHQWEHLVDTGPLMVLAHTAAAVAVALWLASGERALATLIALSAERVAAASPRAAGHLLALANALLAAPLRLPAELRRTAARRVAPTHQAFAHRVVSHRGPPALLRLRPDLSTR